MPTLAATLACALLAALAVFQLLLAAGRPWGRFAWGGRHEVLPARLRVGSLVSVVVYAAIGAVLLARAGVVGDGEPGEALRIGAWVVTAYFVLGTLMNLASRSRAERAVMTPTAAALAVLSLLVALA